MQGKSSMDVRQERAGAGVQEMKVTQTGTWQLTMSCMALSLLSLAAGCSGGGGATLIAISPSTTQTIDGGQALPIEVSLVNDPQKKGVAFNLQGSGSLSTASVTFNGSSSKTTVLYTAPTQITAATSATVIASSINTPSSSAALNININPALVITTTALASGTVNQPYTATIGTSGGSGGLVFSITSGTLPAGLTLTGNTISGTPTTSGSSTFTVSVTDGSAVPTPTTQSYTLSIVAQPPVVTTTSLPNAVAGTMYSQQLTFSGGGGQTPAWSENGALPAGLTLSTSGVISGIPTNASAGQSYNFTVQVTVGTQTSAAQQLSITVPALPVVTTTSLPSGNIGTPYSRQLTYSGGAGGTVSWGVASGTLPAGLTLSTSGLLSGTPTTALTYNFSVTVTVGTQTSAAQALTVVINSLVVTSPAAAYGEVGLAFQLQLTAAGGTGPYTWGLAAGSNPLPAGLAMAASGLITGTPTSSTGSPFSGIVVQATDSKAATATLSMTFTISAARSAASNALLAGQYDFLLSGFDAAGKPLAVAGDVVSNGTGGITGGQLDENGTGLAAATNLSVQAGSYSVGADGRGKVTITTGAGTQTFVVALNSAGTAGYMTELDASGVRLSGVLQQTSGSLTTASVTGGFAYGEQGFAVNSAPGALVHRAVAGELQWNAGVFASGESLSSINSGSGTPVTTTAATLTIGTLGRGTLALTAGGVSNFIVYEVSPSQLFLLSADPASGAAGTNDLLYGQALKQTIASGSFAASSLRGVSVLRSESLGTTLSTGVQYPDVQVGLYTFDGVSAVTLASDENAGGTTESNALTGSYTVAANGRVTVSLAPAGIGGCLNCVNYGKTYFYLVGSDQGFVMDFTNAAASGSFEPQTATGITNATLSGTYAEGTLLPLSAAATTLTGALSSNGSLTGTLDEDAGGNLQVDVPFTSSYTAAASGRTTLTLGGDSAVLYLVSPTKAVALDLTTAAPVVQEWVH